MLAERVGALLTLILNHDLVLRSFLLLLYANPFDPILFHMLGPKLFVIRILARLRHRRIIKPFQAAIRERIMLPHVLQEFYVVVPSLLAFMIAQALVLLDQFVRLAYHGAAPVLGDDR